tara:strand:- start:43 stop:1308 length:1266 start_codon:yes stop_codon:yes gene_type:complete
MVLKPTLVPQHLKVMHLDDITEKKINEAIDSGLFRPDLFPRAEYETKGIYCIPTNRVHFYQDSNLVNYQPYKSGVPISIQDAKKLAIQFEPGVDFNQPIPMVTIKKAVYNEDGSLNVYKSLFQIEVGNHRLLMFNSNGVEYYAFEVVEFPNEAEKFKIGLGSNYNLDKPKGTTQSATPLINAGIRLVANEELPKDEDAIESWVYDIDPQRHWKSRKAIVEAIMNGSGIVSMCESMSETKITKLIKDHNLKKTTKMLYNKKSGKYGTTLANGYAQKQFLKAFKKFMETGTTTSAIMYAEDDSIKTHGIMKARALVMDDYNQEIETWQNMFDKIRKEPSLKPSEILSTDNFVAQINNHDDYETEVKSQPVYSTHPAIQKELKIIEKNRKDKAASVVANETLGAEKSDSLQEQVTATLDEVFEV